MIFTQRASISAVCGYSSLSIMFLSAVCAISRSAWLGHPRRHERREVEPRAAVEQQLARDRLARELAAEPVLGERPRREADLRVLARVVRARPPRRMAPGAGQAHGGNASACSDRVSRW